MKNYLKSAGLSSCLAMILIGIGMLVFTDLQLIIRILILVFFLAFAGFGLYVLLAKNILNGIKDVKIGIADLARCVGVALFFTVAFLILRQDAEINRGALVLTGSMAIALLLFLPYQIALYFRQ